MIGLLKEVLLKIRSAEDYETRWKGYLNHTHSKFLSRLATEPGERILDPSCGTGKLAYELLKLGFPFRELVLNDKSEAMIKVVRKRLPTHPGISIHQSEIEMMTLKDEYFTMILCLNSFHLYKNQSKVVESFYQTLQQGGELLILDWNREGLFRFVNTFIKWYVPESINTRSASEMEQLLRKHNFKIIELDCWWYRYWNLFIIKACK